MKTKLIVAGAAAMLLGGTALAQNPSYNFVEARYLDSEIRRVDGFGVNVQGLIAPQVYLLGRYSQLDFGPSDLDTLQVGAGYRFPLERGTDLIGELSYIRTEAGSGNDNGYGISAGVRHFFTSALEANATIDHTNIDRTNTAFTVGGVLHFTPQIAGVLAYTFDDADVFSIGARLNF